MFADLIKYLTLSMIVFLIGISGIILNRQNIIIMLMSIELMLLAVNLNFIIFSVYLDEIMGQLFALLVLTIAAAESAIVPALKCHALWCSCSISGGSRSCISITTMAVSYTHLTLPTILLV